MSKLKISENLFLEVAELNRLVKFLSDDGYKRVLKSIINQYGIVRNTGNTFFKVTQKNTGVVTINAGLAFDSNLDAIVMKTDLDLSVSDTGVRRWLILSRSVHNWEEGTVSVTVDGALNGIGTRFTEILRGQPNFPTKVKFNSANNTSEYEVVSVTSDSQAVLSGSFVAESGKQFSVVGTFTPGFVPTPENKQIYEFDGYNIRIQDSADKPEVGGDEFILGYVYYENGIMYVFDERVYCMFNETYTQDTETSGISPLTSLLQATIVSGVDSWKAKSCDIELILEHGYKVNSFELNSTATQNVFQITTGSCNFLGDSAVPDGIFNGWILLNRINMKYVKIDSNIGKNLYISDFDAEIVDRVTNDFVIVPNFTEIEYEVKLNDGTIRPSVPFYFRESIANLNSRIRVYALFPSFGGADNVTISIRYRFIDNSGKRYAFQDLAVAPYVNVNGEQETLANSSFSVDIASIEPEAEQRNYS